MKIRIEKNLVTFFNTYYDFSISRYCIYLSYCFKKPMAYRNWIYDKNNKNIIEMQPKQLYYRDKQVLRYIK